VNIMQCVEQSEIGTFNLRYLSSSSVND